MGPLTLFMGNEWYMNIRMHLTSSLSRMPFFCVSIGLCVGKVPVLGVVYNPMSDELFSAARGHGATLNGRPIHVNQSARTLGSSLLLTEFTTKEKAEATVRDVLLLMQHCRSVRRAQGY